MSKYVLVAETGSDITAAAADQLGMYLAPMHVSLGEVTKDDGAFPVEEIVEFYQTNAKLPKTSGCTPEDFIVLFDRIHAEHPEAHIIHLAYSAVTTCSYQSAILAAEGRDYVTCIDTRQVSAGQAAIVMKLHEAIAANPDMTLDEVKAAADDLINRARMWFVPDNLEFLKAGGRVSNATYILGSLLKIHPRIELIEGKLVATQKYRGKMAQLAPKMVNEFAVQQEMEKDCLWLIKTPGLAQQTQDDAEEAGRALGFERVEWIKTGCVITTHGGPGAFGVAGFVKK